MEGYKTHVFICTHEKVGKPSCGAKGSSQLRDELKAMGKSLGDGLRVNASGCLGQCEQGIACVIYPEGEWHLNLKVEDKADLLSLIEKKIKG